MVRPTGGVDTGTPVARQLRGNFWFACSEHNGGGGSSRSFILRVQKQPPRSDRHDGGCGRHRLHGGLQHISIQDWRRSDLLLRLDLPHASPGGRSDTPAGFLSDTLVG